MSRKAEGSSCAGWGQLHLGCNVEPGIIVHCVYLTFYIECVLLYFQTNISNNNNKFYILQLLEDDTAKLYRYCREYVYVVFFSFPFYSVWFRWGRVGYTGQSDLKLLGGDLEQAKKIFCKKFSDKTGNDWSERNEFDRIPGKYTLIPVSCPLHLLWIVWTVYTVKMDYTGGENQKDAKDEVKMEEDAEQLPVSCFHSHSSQLNIHVCRENRPS